MRILVVEDEHRIAASIKKGLEMEKYSVDLAYTGTDGLDLASSEDYDLIILDLMLPNLDGLEICRRLRADSIHTPILILTARDQLNDKVSGLNDGADDYLTKPFAFEELLARVRALLRRPAQSLGEVLIVGNLVMDPRIFTVTLNHQPLQLSSREFSLLEYLMRHPNRIISKNQIISHVWNYDSDILPNTVEVYIKKLRLKINSDSPQIETIRGFGYRLTSK